MKIKCPRCVLLAKNSPPTGSIIRLGSYYRSSDQKYIRRWLCKACRRSFSSATGDPCFNQKKRQLNPLIFEALSSTNSQRRIAINLTCNRKTIVRKFLFLASQAEAEFNEMNRARSLVSQVQFDDMESHEHTKYKPVSMTVAVTPERFVIGLAVAEMPCARNTFALAEKKYGRRKDQRQPARLKMLRGLLPFVKADATFTSDQNPNYPKGLRNVFPLARHIAVKGRKPRLNGQGELKIGPRDPLFALNHTAAMFRANVNRLIRKTWCTTKKMERLQANLILYAVYHNRRVAAQIQKEEQRARTSNAAA